MARYPRELEERLHLPGLGPALLRPIRAEDAAQYRRGFAALSPEDIRRRFHMPLGGLSDAMVERLTCIDYETEMAFVLEMLEPEQEAIHGGMLVAVGRVVGDDAALLVCPYRRRLGIGTLLLQRLAAYARRQGRRELRGDIQADNAPMLALAARLGCTLSPVPDCAGIVRASWLLA